MVQGVLGNISNLRFSQYEMAINVDYAYVISYLLFLMTYYQTVLFFLFLDDIQI